VKALGRHALRRGRRQAVRRWLVLLAVIGALATHQGEGRADPIDEAAAHFDRGKTLYNKGLYDEAIQAFSAANRLATHRAALFNIGRCYQNLAKLDRALRYYRQALAVTRDTTRRASLERRIARLESRPVEVLVTTRPDGASVTVDAGEQPERGVTPQVLRLVPGPHLLLFRRKGHLLTSKRVVVLREKGARVDVALPAEAAPIAARPCPKQREATPPGLVKTKGLHLHASLLSTVNISSDQNFSAGPGVLLHLSLDRLLLGTQVLLFINPTRSQKVPVSFQGSTYDEFAFRRLITEAVGGWLFPYRSFYLHASAGLGMLIDRGIFSNSTDDFVKEMFAFSWSLGGGAEAMATPWLSFGVSLRLGMAHVVDDAISTVSNEDREAHIVLGHLWASATFHL
jgi:Tetratricopeptide repeat